MVSFELGREIGKDVVRLMGAESEGLRFDSSWGLRIFFFVPRSGQDEKHLSLLKTNSCQPLVEE